LAGNVSKRQTPVKQTANTILLCDMFRWWTGRYSCSVLCKMFHGTGGPCRKSIRPHFPECAAVDAAGLISTRTLVTLAMARTVVISLLFAGPKFAASALKRMLLRGI